MIEEAGIRVKMSIEEYVEYINAKLLKRNIQAYLFTHKDHPHALCVACHHHHVGNFEFDVAEATGVDNLISSMEIFAKLYDTAYTIGWEDSERETKGRLLMSGHDELLWER